MNVDRRVWRTRPVFKEDNVMLGVFLLGTAVGYAPETNKGRGAHGWGVTDRAKPAHPYDDNRFIEQQQDRGSP